MTAVLVILGFAVAFTSIAVAVPAGGGEGRDDVSPAPRRPPAAGADGGRPTRPALSREYILRATLALINQDGVEAFSMRRLGAHLGVDPMSIYHYLPNKGALFDGLVELIGTEVSFDALGEHQPWPDQAAAVMRRFRAAPGAHPKAVTPRPCPLSAPAPPSHPPCSTCSSGPSTGSPARAFPTPPPTT